MDKDKLAQVGAKLAALKEPKAGAGSSRGGIRETKVRCVTNNCPGMIVEKLSYQYLGDPGLLMVGPGSSRQLSPVTELYCPNCGISYHHLPKLRPEGGKKF